MRSLNFRFIPKIVLSVLVTVGSMPAQPAIIEEHHVPGRILVKFRPEVSDARAHEFLERNGVQSQGVIPGTGIHVLALPPFANEAALAHAFQGQAELEFVELDRILQPSSIMPNDPNFVLQWPLTKIAAPDAWSTTTGSSSIVIAFVDTGVDATHEDLVSRMVPGWNIYNNSSDTRDVYNHGTPAAGTAAETTNNSIGSAGICWNCMIMPVRVSDIYGGASMSNIASGITWAANHGARVVNIGYAVTNDPAVTTAAQYLQSKGGVAVAPSGNDGLLDSMPDNPYIITVGATDFSDLITSWSNRGNNLDLVAPMANAYAPVAGGYAFVYGTSISSAMVAGVAGLTLSWRPGLSPADLTRVLQLSADDKGTTGWDSTYGWGRVNALRALTQSVPSTSDTIAPTVSISAPANGSTVSGTSTVTAAASDNVGVSSVTIAAAGITLCTATVAPYFCSWNTTSLANGGPYAITATARDAAGNTSSASISVSVNNTVADTTPPAVSISAPASGSTVSGTVTITASASDNVSVSSVTISASGVLCTPLAPPYSCAWNTMPLANGGPYTITATARDAAGNSNSASISVTVNNPDATAPAVSVSAPGNGSNVFGSVTITANASDNVGVSSVTILAGGTTVCTDLTAPYSCAWNTMPLANGGPYTITATARDAAGNSNSASISVTVNNPTVDTAPPTVSISAPGNGAAVFGNVTITANASDNVGVSSVTISAGGTALCTTATAPYSCSWNTTSVANGGPYTITATARDAAGNSNTASSSAMVSNDTTGPSVQFINPLRGAELSGTTTVQVVAADPDGVVRMELYVSGKLLATSSTNSLFYRWNTKKFRGSQTLETRAYDSRGYLGQGTVSVTVR